jgi:hypothetical protein
MLRRDLESPGSPVVWVAAGVSDRRHNHTLAAKGSRQRRKEIPPGSDGDNRRGALAKAADLRGSKQQPSLFLSEAVRPIHARVLHSKRPPRPLHRTPPAEVPESSFIRRNLAQASKHGLGRNGLDFSSIKFSDSPCDLFFPRGINFGRRFRLDAH